MIFMDFICVTLFASIANQDGHSDHLVENMSHHLPLISYNVEIGNIYNVIPVQLVFDVDGLRVGRSTNQLDFFHVLLVITFLLITFSFKLGDTGISMSSTDAAEWRFMNFRDSCINPGLISLKGLRLTFLQKLMLWKKLLNFCIKYTMSKFIRMLFSENCHGLFQTSNATLLGHINDINFVRVAEHICLLLGITLVKNRMFHVFVILLILIIVIGSPSNHADHCIDSIFLFIGKGVEDLFNCFSIFLFGCFFCLLSVSHFLFLLFC